MAEGPELRGPTQLCALEGDAVLVEAKDWWERNGPRYQEQCQIPIAVLYGGGCPEENEIGLIGSVADRDVLEIGCGGAQCAIAFAKMGARVTALDFASSEILFAKQLAAEHEVEISFLLQDMADLAPITSTSQDLVFSSNAFAYVDDLDRCFAEVFRVLRPTGMFVWAMGHPLGHVVDSETLQATQSYFDTDPKVVGRETGNPFASVHRTFSDYYNLLVDAGFLIERVLEPDSRQRYDVDPWYGLWGKTEQYHALIPSTIIFKCRRPE